MCEQQMLEVQAQALPSPSVDAPFAYLRDPFCAEMRGDPEVDSVARTWRDGEFGKYDPEAQVWSYPEGVPSMGVWTKSQRGTSSSTTPTARPDESPDWYTDDTGWGTDDACA